MKTIEEKMLDEEIFVIKKGITEDFRNALVAVNKKQIEIPVDIAPSKIERRIKTILTNRFAALSKKLGRDLHFHEVQYAKNAVCNKIVFVVKRVV